MSKLNLDTMPCSAIDYQPGDGTRYRCVAVKLPPGVWCGHGAPATWVVSFPDFGCSYYITEGTYLHERYIASKFRVHGAMANEHTAQMMAQAITKVVPGTTCQKREA